MFPSGRNVSSNYGQRRKKHRTKVLGKAQQSSVVGIRGWEERGVTKGTKGRGHEEDHEDEQKEICNEKKSGEVSRELKGRRLSRTPMSMGISNSMWTMLKV